MGKENASSRLAPIARRQHGPFTRQQALGAGFSSSAITRNVACGRWLDVHRGVYCDAVIPASLERDASAAVLACGPTAAASHRTAAALWGLDVPRTTLPEVTVLPTARARPAGVTVHKTDRLSPSEAADRDGIRTTSPKRTLVDLASCVEPALVELALDRLWRRKLVDPQSLAVYLDDDWCRARRGTGELRRLVSERIGDRPSGSDIETQFLQLLRDAGLPLPARQHPVVTPFGPRYLDLAYPKGKLAIELDGMESRLDRGVFLDERDRQNLIQEQGWTFRRFGHAHVTGQSVWTVFTVAAALGFRPVRWVR